MKKVIFGAIIVGLLALVWGYKGTETMEVVFTSEPKGHDVCGGGTRVTYAPVIDGKVMHDEADAICDTDDWLLFLGLSGFTKTKSNEAAINSSRDQKLIAMIETNGWRFPMASMFRNIISVKLTDKTYADNSRIGVLEAENEKLRKRIAELEDQLANK